jgi:uncharacterized LabA/DUF88 family protein
MAEMQRVISYVDGFNLYFGLRDSGLRRYLWLDLLKLSENNLKSSQVLVEAKYFTSHISGPPNKRRRQLAYLEALGTLDARKFAMYFGKYQENPRRCGKCGAEESIPAEKMTDVNIAVEMLKDAFQDRFDVALLVSADSDLCPVITSVRALFPRKAVVAAFPPDRASKEIASVANAHFVVGRARFASSQFPEAIEKADGYILRKPDSWQ